MKLSSTLFVIYNFDFVEKKNQILVKMFNMIEVYTAPCVSHPD